MLNGIRILDFGKFIAGPYSSHLLACLGAEVIRVESKHGGGDRNLGAPTDEKIGPVFMQVNANKLGMTVDVRKPGGSELQARLIESADVVIANVPKKTLKDMELDYERIKAINPKIILTHITGFGPKGSYSTKPSFDGIAQTMSGSTYMSGFGEQPSKSAAPWVDYGTGQSAAFATLAALYERQQTGQGKLVEVNLLHHALSVMHALNLEQKLSKIERKRSGSRSQIAAPCDLIKTKDGWIMMQVIGDRQFRNWAGLTGFNEDPASRKYATDHNRGENGEALSAATAEWAKDLTSEEALKALESAGIPAGPMLSPADTFADAHIREMGIMQEIKCEGYDDPVPLMSPPFSCPVEPERLLRSSAPGVGEHTDEIARALGFSVSEIQSLRESGTI